MIFNEEYNKVLEELIRTTIFEHAFHLKYVKDDMRSKSDVIGDHILKLILYETNENTNHWITEIKGWLLSIYKKSRKIKNKIKLEENDFYDSLYIEPFEECEEYIQSFYEEVCNQYPSLNNYFIAYSIPEVQNKLKDVYTKISKVMVLNKYSEEKIDNILKNI